MAATAKDYQEQVEFVRKEMVEYMAKDWMRGTGLTEAHRKESYFRGLAHYGNMSTEELFEEYSTQRYKDGQDSMSYY